MSEKITAILDDVYDADGNLKPLTVKVKADAQGVYVQPEGYGDMDADIGAGCPVVIEYKDGEPFVVIWGDINNEEPTHNISLAGAKESLRKEEEDD